jgi:putative hydrolase of the HAD superfamily
MKFDIGVVSNFKVPGGIECILQQQRLAPFFNFVITSIQVGWRKPHKAIYKAALIASNVRPDEILFIGDDYENDFKGPKDIGMQALLLDRMDKHPCVKE